MELESQPNQNDLVRFLDPSVSPAEDFYAHVNQRWCDKNPIPAKEGRWGVFMVLREETKKQLQELLLALSQDATLAEGGNRQKLRDLFLVGMDEARIERDGLAPVQYTLGSVYDITLPHGVFVATAKLHRIGATPFFGPMVVPDTKQSDICRLYFEQAGLTLPDRDYYLSSDEKFVKIRAEFLSYMERMHCLLGDTPEEAATRAKAILAIETRLAQVSLSATERREEEKQYHPMTVSELALLAPAIPWSSYFENLGISEEPDYIIVRQPEFVRECNRLVEEAEKDARALFALKTYLRWHFIDTCAKTLPKVFSSLQFEFHGKVLTGSLEERPRWERVLGIVGSVLGEALGELYVEKHFPSEAKARVHELVGDLQEVFKARLEKLSWMGEKTKARALAKLATFTRKLGYPEKWRDYSRFRVSIRDSYAENYMRGCTVAFERELRKIDKEVDKTEWHMLPQTVNAMYNHQWNQITFPAAILQPPFFDPRADDAVNYGAIGSVIGHELTHGFDDQGCKFDEEGNLSEWWTEEDKKCFAEKATVLVKQFSECTFFDIPVNGELTLGENIADLGGISIAFEALARAMTRKGRQENIDGFTPEQRFFLGYALVWRGNIREELARQYITIDPHSPGPLRVNMPLSNFPPFHEAFGCREGCAMYRPPEERAEIW